MWDSIKSFSEVYQDDIALLAMIKFSSKIFQGDDKLGFTRMRFAEAMLDIRQDLELFKVGHDVAKYNMFLDFTGNSSDEDESVVRGK